LKRCSSYAFTTESEIVLPSRKTPKMIERRSIVCLASCRIGTTSWSARLVATPFVNVRSFQTAPSLPAVSEPPDTLEIR